MLKINLLRIEGTRDRVASATWLLQTAPELPWYRYDLAWTAWIRANF